MTIFPIIQPQVLEEEKMPLYKEIAWDYRENKPIWKNGSPVVVTGGYAVRVWAWNALQTVRGQHEIYTWNYGCEIESLIGATYTEDLKKAEAARYVRECLKANPYIEEIKNIQVSFADGVIQVTCILETIYGEVTI